MPSSPPPPVRGLVSDALRAAIEASGRSPSELGVEPNVLGRFARGDGLPLSAVDALARSLGLELRQVDRPPPAIAAVPARRGRPPVKRRPRAGIVADVVA